MQWRVSLACSGLGGVGTAQGAEPIRLVRDGKPAATIVVADQPAVIPLSVKGKQLTAAYAAEELQRFIEKASGARLDIVSAAKAPAEGTLVLVGRSALSDKFGLRPPTRPEGLSIVTFPRGVAILGEVAATGNNVVPPELDRGTLHGVYEFLERCVGYRFYIHIPDSPDLGIVTPQAKEVALPAGYSLDLSPDFPFRRAAFATWGDPPAWMRVVREGSGTGFPGVNHTDMAWSWKLPPEMYARGEGVTRANYWLCYSAPGLVAKRMEMCEERYAKLRDRIEYSAWPAGPRCIVFEPEDFWDWSGRCYCEACKAAYDETRRGRFGKNSNLLFRHGVELAKAIGKRWPGKRLGMLAYEGHMLPPEFDLPDNLDVQVCMMWATTMGKEPYWHQRNLQLLRDWSKKVGGRRDRLYVWNYYCWPAFWTDAPLFFPHNLQNWLQDTYEISSGEFINPGGNPPQYEMLMCWLWHRLMWNRNAGVDALIRDHATRLFGPAGDTMERFYRLIGDRYEKVPWTRQFNESYVPPEQMYGETYTPDVITAARKLLRDALARCPEDERDIHRRRVVWMQEGFAPFFQEAGLAHRWLGNPPAHTVAAVKAAPAEDAAWQALPAAPLVEGNYGKEPDLATQVRMARHGDTIHVRFEAAEPTAPAKEDRVTLRLQQAGRILSLRATGDGTVQGELGAELLGSTHKSGVWTVTVRFPAAAVGLDAGKAGTLDAQIERHRAHRGAGKGPGTDYFWMPPMKPPWDWPPRFGKLRVEAAR